MSEIGDRRMRLFNSQNRYYFRPNFDVRYRVKKPITVTARYPKIH